MGILLPIIRNFPDVFSASNIYMYIFLDTENRFRSIFKKCISFVSVYMDLSRAVFTRCIILLNKNCTNRLLRNKANNTCLSPTGLIQYNIDTHYR